MTHPSLTIPGSLYRPKKLPRVIRRQYAVIRLTVILVIIGVAALAIAWRNILHERLAIDVARQRAETEILQQEITHLEGMVESAASYPVIASWAEQQHGWKPIRGRVNQISLSGVTCSPDVHREALLQVQTHE